MNIEWISETVTAVCTRQTTERIQQVCPEYPRQRMEICLVYQAMPQGKLWKTDGDSEELLCVCTMPDREITKDDVWRTLILSCQEHVTRIKVPVLEMRGAVWNIHYCITWMCSEVLKSTVWWILLWYHLDRDKRLPASPSGRRISNVSHMLGTLFAKNIKHQT